MNPPSTAGGTRSALVLVDIQPDFLSGGALAIGIVNSYDALLEGRVEVAARSDLEAAFFELPWEGKDTATVALLPDPTQAWLSRWELVQKAKQSIDVAYFILPHYAFNDLAQVDGHARAHGQEPGPLQPIGGDVLGQHGAGDVHGQHHVIRVRLRSQCINATDLVKNCRLAVQVQGFLGVPVGRRAISQPGEEYADAQPIALPPQTRFEPQPSEQRQPLPEQPVPLGAADVADWKAIARRRLAVLDAEIVRLQRAREYLEGALLCRYDHPATDCRIMGQEIDRRLAPPAGQPARD